ncbi:MAG TPA: lipocalin-like domain-containing protein [Candidatus Polarisedimenticolia bacterium]|nr:lipocalin-like domain-containing protein [Candidatus Polarisedimenticolia bacterium]
MTISESRRRGAAACAAAVLAASVMGGAPVSTNADGWRIPSSGHVWSFPRDHWRHDGYKTQWWYLTGHLESAALPARRLGYQITFFRIGLAAGGEDAAATGGGPERRSAWSTRHLAMGHAALTDLDAGEHRFSDLLYREVPLLAGFDPFPGPRLAWTRGPAGTQEEWDLRWNGEGFDLSMADRGRGFSLKLSTRALKPLVMQGPGGLSRKGSAPSAVSLYYSFTRMATQGTVSLDGRALEVRGESWMDKEISSSSLGPDQEGWDWFGLQLADGREIMLYVLRRRDGRADAGNATVVEQDGTARILSREEWSVRSTGSWRSPATGTLYPSGWAISIPSQRIHLVVTPILKAQENVAERSADLHYWEGAVELRDASGAAAGRGYVELTGYGEGNRPPV